jgi:hypothetical protein
LKGLLALGLAFVAGGVGMACDLCAVYSADNAEGQRDAGLILNVSEAFTPFGTVLLNNEEISGSHQDFRDTSVTHIVPGYNFNSWLGLNLNLPLVYHHFQRSEVRYSFGAPPVVGRESGTIFEPGDLSLITRWTVFERSSMRFGVTMNLLAGVKFPTGDTERIRDEVSQTQIYDALAPPGVPHDPLGHSISGVHPHDLSPGSGSFDGIFGLTARTRWKRWFLAAQFQYYLRTEGESGYEYGDELMLSGGPGFYLLLADSFSLNLQANASYDRMRRDELLGRSSDQTGFTAWYFGPQIGLTAGSRFSAAAGVDVPLHITANGLQNVPDYRVHVSLGWRF